MRVNHIRRLAVAVCLLTNLTGASHEPWARQEKRPRLMPIPPHDPAGYAPPGAVVGRTDSTIVL
jgi:hypothetical protein